ncbi:MAG TPA: hypothetical protein VJ888_09805 [Mobilitalea sp.]|nr:hypothetical protein [Mobilitalea sp.]
MSKRFMLLSILLCLILALGGCGSDEKDSSNKDNKRQESRDKDSEDDDEDGKAKAIEDIFGEIISDNLDDISEDAFSDEVEDIFSDEAEDIFSDDVDDFETIDVEPDGNFKMMSDISNYWFDLYTLNETEIEEAQGLIILDFIKPGTSFLTAIPYDALNYTNADGHFEGELMLSGRQGTMDRDGGKITFGCEVVLEEDGYNSEQKGDIKVENGSCDLDKGYLFIETYTERKGEVRIRSTSEFQKQQDGSMISIYMDGSNYNYSEEEELKTSYIFIRSSKGQFDYVIANSDQGTKYEHIFLEEDMTKKMAISIFEAAGATIEASGGIVDGALVSDK